MTYSLIGGLEILQKNASLEDFMDYLISAFGILVTFVSIYVSIRKSKSKSKSKVSGNRQKVVIEGKIIFEKHKKVK